MSLNFVIAAPKFPLHDYVVDQNEVPGDENFNVVRRSCFKMNFFCLLFIMHKPLKSFMLTNNT